MAVIAAASRDALVDVVRERLPTLNVVDVAIDARDGSDGDPLYWVTVVYDGDRPEPGGMLGLIRHARSRLAQFGDDRFPIFSFMTKSDAKAMAAAT